VRACVFRCLGVCVCVSPRACVRVRVRAVWESERRGPVLERDLVSLYVHMYMFFSLCTHERDYVVPFFSLDYGEKRMSRETVHGDKRYFSV